MWHILNLMLQVAPKKKSHTVRSGEREGHGQSVGQEIAPEDIAELCYSYGMKPRLAATTWNFYRYCECESLSESRYSV